MWTDPEEMSRWAYNEINKDFNSDFKSLIITSKWSYLYCEHIENDPEIRKNIIDPYYAYKYLIELGYDPRLEKIVLNSEFDHWYELHLERRNKNAFKNK